MQQQRKHLICFDLDNTLIHGNKAHLEAYKYAFAKNELRPSSEKDILKHFGLVSHLIIKKLYPSLSRKQLRKVNRDHEDALLTRTYSFVKPILGARECLKELRKWGYRLALVTNCNRRVLKKITRTSGIDKTFFNVLVSYNKPLHPKPAPDEIFKAEHLLSMQADYMVGDTIYDLVAARRAGVRAIGVCTGTESKAQLQKKRPYAILRSVAELPRFLKKEQQSMNP